MITLLYLDKTKTLENLTCLKRVRVFEYYFHKL